MNQDAYVIKRNGKTQPMVYDKITNRLKKLSYGLDHQHCNVHEIAKKVIGQLPRAISTSDIDKLSAETAAYLCGNHYHNDLLASRIAVSNLQKNTTKSFATTMTLLANSGQIAMSDEFLECVLANSEKLDAQLIHDRDYNITYFGFKTLEKSYLLQIDDKIAERIQHLYMRVAVQIHGSNLPAVLETYELLSRKKFTHATPTLFNSGFKCNQLSSCYLLQVKDDSIDGIYDTLKDTAKISKHSGGIGLALSTLRARGSRVVSTNGKSGGLTLWCQLYCASARAVDQGGGKRKGSNAIYLEPWHLDVFDVIDLKSPHGNADMKARDLDYALWVPDLFMKRVESNGKWTLFCPSQAPGLNLVHSEEFEELYTRYEQDSSITRKKVIDAQELWHVICNSLIETGEPYILFKDSCNRKSNQKNLGTIQCSNLCTEIIQYTAPDEIAVCNLASISLKEFVRPGGYDFKGLQAVIRIMVRNLNQVIDKSYYPVPEARKSNLRHRPIGLGVQGLADVFALLELPFDCAEARELNKDIFENIYYAACEASIELAKENGKTYESYPGSPMSQGIFQHDMWDSVKTKLDWDSLRKKLLEHGIYNSLLVAPMPTASTAQILGNNECFEPFTTNYYSRRVLAGDFMVVNQYLVDALIREGLWSLDMKNKILLNRGSIKAIPGIPDHIKEIYRTVWEIKQKSIIDMAADRAPFIDQSQSMNLFMEDPSYSKVSSMLFHSWRKGLKTGVYYLRTRPKANPIQFTVETGHPYDLPKSGQSILSPVTSRHPEPEETKQPDASKPVEATSSDESDPCFNCGS